MSVPSAMTLKPCARGKVAHVKDHRPELLSVEIQQEVSCQNWELHGRHTEQGARKMFWSVIYLEGVWVGSSNHTVQRVRKHVLT